MTNSPLNDGDVDLQGGIEMLPESRPEKLGGSNNTLGLNGQLSYGFSNNFNLTMKGWVDIQGREIYHRHGYSIGAQFVKKIDDKSRRIVLPRFGIAFNDGNVAGYGIGGSIIYQSTINDNLSWYGGAGFAWGFRYLEKDLNFNDEEKLPMGFGVLGNLGLGWNLSHSLRLNFELSPIYQLNSFDDNSQFLLAPSVGMGYTIRQSKGE